MADIANCVYLGRWKEVVSEFLKGILVIASLICPWIPIILIGVYW